METFDKIPDNCDIWAFCLRFWLPWLHSSKVTCSGSDKLPTILTAYVFVPWQVWLWPMWTPACLLIRPPLQLSASENIFWTWFLPALSPKQQTHGNNAIPLLIDTITISSFNIDNSHSHYCSNSFYGLCLWPKWCRISLVLDRGVLTPPPVNVCYLLSYLNPSPVGVVLRQLQDTRNMLNIIWVPF